MVTVIYEPERAPCGFNPEAAWKCHLCRTCDLQFCEYRDREVEP